MASQAKRQIAVFYCQNTPGSGEQERQSLEKRYGDRLRLYPVPCTGRVEPLHLLKALEGFADAVYVIACPEGACRYFEGNRWAGKRVERTRTIISSIGLEEERVAIVRRDLLDERPLGALAEECIAASRQLRPSPVHNRAIS